MTSMRADSSFAASCDLVCSRRNACSPSRVRCRARLSFQAQVRSLQNLSGKEKPMSMLPRAGVAWPYPSDCLERVLPETHPLLKGGASFPERVRERPLLDACFRLRNLYRVVIRD